ncbi:hypothetical protein NQ315_012250 [Exocentrus adspersus]|uniref:CCHC-type domain-containing protein n=1 Tax=Exocentrus adspersus TaxID=1586481 RepID=A0AAV8VFL6_9CUCU|nr:hypothetical protein NQ315_012250 [Exocentrus adspersus]
MTTPGGAKTPTDPKPDPAAVDLGDLRLSWIYKLRKDEIDAELDKFRLDLTGTVEEKKKRLVRFIREGCTSPRPGRQTEHLQFPVPPPLPTTGNQIPSVQQPSLTAPPATTVPPFPGAVSTFTVSTVCERVRKWNLRFNGKTDAVEFLEKLCEFQEHSGISTTALLPTLYEIFQGNALAWYRNNRELWSCWEDFVTDFKQFYLPVDYESFLEEQIYHRRQQPGESGRDYLVAIQTLLRRHGGFTPEKALYRLHGNLRPEYKEYIRLSDVQGARDLVRRIEEFETIQEEKSRSKARQPNAIPSYGNRPKVIAPPPAAGATPGQNPEPTTAPPRPTAMPGNHRSPHPTTPSRTASSPNTRSAAGNTATTGSGFDRNSICWRCGKGGHFRSQCQAPPRLFCSRYPEGSPEDNEIPTAHTDRLQKLKEVYELVRVNLAQAFTSQSHYYNLRRREWRCHVGDRVMKRENPLSSAAKGFAAKLAPKYSGPYTVTAVVSPVVYDLRSDTGRKLSHIHIKDLKPFVPYSAEVPSTPAAPSPARRAPERRTRTAGPANPDRCRPKAEMGPDTCRPSPNSGPVPDAGRSAKGHPPQPSSDDTTAGPSQTRGSGTIRAFEPQAPTTARLELPVAEDRPAIPPLPTPAAAPAPEVTATRDQPSIELAERVFRHPHCGEWGEDLYREIQALRPPHYRPDRPWRCRFVDAAQRVRWAMDLTSLHLSFSSDDEDPVVRALEEALREPDDDIPPEPRAVSPIVPATGDSAVSDHKRVAPDLTRIILSLQDEPDLGIRLLGPPPTAAPAAGSTAPSTDCHIYLPVDRWALCWSPAYTLGVARRHKQLLAGNQTQQTCRPRAPAQRIRLSPKVEYSARAQASPEPAAQSPAKAQVYPGHSKAKEPVADQPLHRADVPSTRPGTDSEPVRKQVHSGPVHSDAPPY